MKIGIGIDTGGTYTDIVAYNYDETKVLFKNKTLTTKEDLTICISRSLDSLPEGLLEHVVSICLSTTLATNACVEGKGGKARLVLLGLPEHTVDTLGIDQKYGIAREDTMCVNTGGSFDGKEIDEPDWDELYKSNADFFENAQSLAFSELNALRNGAIVERHARNFFSEKTGNEVVIASDLANELNFIERGATAQLNARLLPVISDFIAAVTQVLRDRNLDIPVMILRSDGSLMSTDASKSKPVETILSGPAASVIGGRGITDIEDCLIVDIGGTTTDISIVESGNPVMTDSIRIGGWRTQVRGVFIDTYGLGGDSRIIAEKGKLELESRRVVPICIFADEHPWAVESLENLVARNRKADYPIHEFLYLQKEPGDIEDLTDSEKRILDALSDGPVMLSGSKIDIYRDKPERLEDLGVVMRVGLTPTDIMHAKGDFNRFNTHASELAIQHFANSLYPSKTQEGRQQAAKRVCDNVYSLFRQKLHRYILYALMAYRYPKELGVGLDDQIKKLIERNWLDAIDDKRDPLINVDFNVNATLIGIGAPTHVFLPDVARAMNAKCVIPENAEVANAIGTAIANITVEAVVAIDPVYDSGGISEYNVRTAGGNKYFEGREEALEYARKMAKQDAIDEARTRGALGELTVDVSVEDRRVEAMFGESIILGTKVIGRATGKAVG